MSDLINSVLAQYEKNKQSTSGNSKISREEKMKKFFNTILPDGDESGEKTVRILPTKNGETPFEEVLFHEIQVDGKWLKLWDPSQDNKRSPLNEVRQKLLETGKQSDMEIAKNYRARKFYIVRVIDRDKEEDGIKFWRFKHNIKTEGIFDKIYPIFKKKGDITNPETGRDIILSITLKKAPNGNKYSVVNSIIPEDVGVLSTDEAKINEWVNDDLVWSDCYSVKNEDYLMIVAKGETPRWNSNLNKFVSLEDDGSNNTSGESNFSKESNTPNVEEKQPEPEKKDTGGDNEDLPF